jgi:hypothetical protein
MNKRMMRELQQLPGTLTNNEYKIRPSVVFQLSDKYPFAPPLLKIHGKDHIASLAKLYRTYSGFIKQYNVPIECICCFSITCVWSPCHTCKHVYDEYVAYCALLRQVIATDYFVKRSPFDGLVNSHIVSYVNFFPA